MIKKIKYLLLFVMTLLIGNDIVSASINDHIIDFNRTGTIMITLKESINNIPVENAEITIYKVADFISENSNLEYVYDESIKECNIDLTDLSNKELAVEIDNCITDTQIQSQAKFTNEDGIANFNNLKLGLYLVKQTNKVDGYSNIEPFLVTIPKETDNKWIYDIEAIPKTDIIKLMDITVEKKWNTPNNEKTPTEVTVELLKGEEVIATVTLNEENKWTYTWIQIEASDEYSVREINIPVGYTPIYKQEENIFVITNIKTLIQTGQNNLTIVTLSILGLIFILIGIIIPKRKNYE